MERSRPNTFALLLLTLMVVFQPMMSFAMAWPAQHSDASSGGYERVMEDCPKGMSVGSSSGRSDNQCGGMTLESCSLAISQGNCGLSTVLFPVGEFKQIIQPLPDRPLLIIKGDYRSIVLDTLTPPPNLQLA